eukprot:8699479-Prorocentrum_lima.AAC.1
MTSSLVGSEMCIRDRPTPADHPAASGAGTAEELHLVSWKCRWLVDPPVSYTHLTLPTICSV